MPRPDPQHPARRVHQVAGGDPHRRGLPGRQDHPHQGHDLAGPQGEGQEAGERPQRQHHHHRGPEGAAAAATADPGSGTRSGGHQDEATSELRRGPALRLQRVDPQCRYRHLCRPVAHRRHHRAGDREPGERSAAAVVVQRQRRPLHLHLSGDDAGARRNADAVADPPHPAKRRHAPEQLRRNGLGRHGNA